MRFSNYPTQSESNPLLSDDRYSYLTFWVSAPSLVQKIGWVMGLVKTQPEAFLANPTEEFFQEPKLTQSKFCKTRVTRSNFFLRNIANFLPNTAKID